MERAAAGFFWLDGCFFFFGRDFGGGIYDKAGVLHALTRRFLDGWMCVCVEMKDEGRERGRRRALRVRARARCTVSSRAPPAGEKLPVEDPFVTPVCFFREGAGASRTCVWCMRALARLAGYCVAASGCVAVAVYVERWMGKEGWGEGSTQVEQRDNLKKPYFHRKRGCWMNAHLALVFHTERWVDLVKPTDRLLRS